MGNEKKPNSPKENASPKAASNLEDVKLSREIEKLEAETEAIRVPFYKKVETYTALLPVFLAVAGIFYSYKSGWFESQNRLIEAEKKLLTYETGKLGEQKADQEREVAALRANILLLQDGLVQLTNQINLLVKEKEDLQLAKDYVDQQVMTLARADTNAASAIEAIQKLKKDHALMLTALRHELEKRQLYGAGQNMEYIHRKIAELHRNMATNSNPSALNVQSHVAELEFLSNVSREYADSSFQQFNSWLQARAELRNYLRKLDNNTPLP